MLEWIRTLPHWLIVAAEVLVTVAGTYVVACMVARALKRVLHLDMSPLPSASIFINIARFTVYALGAVLVLQFMGINASAIITALGVGGIAVSLGLQDTIANLVAGLQLSLAKILTPGEYVKIGDQEGVVRDISWRATTIITEQGEEIVIPNAVINKSPVAYKRGS